MSTRRLRNGLGLLGLVVLLGTAGFALLEDWNLFDAFYSTILIISTLGFHEHEPTTIASRLLTVGLIGAGVGTLYYLVGVIAQALIEDQQSWREARRMEHRIARMRGHYIVCGFGRVGQQICRQLCQEQRAFVIIDNDPARIALISSLDYCRVNGDATQDEVLRRAGIERAGGLLTAVGTDAANVYITLSARALSPKLFIVARAATGEAEHKLLIAGANRVISPYIIGGRRMAATVLRPTILDFLDVLIHSDSLEMWLEEIVVGEESPLAGARLDEVRLRETVGVTVLAVRDCSGHMHVNPLPETILNSGDTLIVLGAPDALRLLTS